MLFKTREHNNIKLKTFGRMKRHKQNTTCIFLFIVRFFLLEQ